MFNRCTANTEDRVTYVSVEEFDATASALTAKSDAAIAQRAGTGVFPNAFELTTSTKYAERITPRVTLEGEFAEGVEEIEPASFDASDPRWSRTYKAPKISFAHLPLKPFTHGQLIKLTAAEKKYLREHPIKLDRSQTLPAPTLPDDWNARQERFRTPARERTYLRDAWCRESGEDYGYRTLDADTLNDYGFTVEAS